MVIDYSLQYTATYMYDSSTSFLLIKAADIDPFFVVSQERDFCSRWKKSLNMSLSVLTGWSTQVRFQDICGLS